MGAAGGKCAMFLEGEWTSQLCSMRVKQEDNWMQEAGDLAKHKERRGKCDKCEIGCLFNGVQNMGEPLSETSMNHKVGARTPA
jgi:hypothetical protein